MKYHHADPSVDYMTFLEECRKAEDEDRASKSKIKGKLKIAAATISSTQSDAIAKQLKRQQQQLDTLMGKMQSMIATLQSHTAQASSTFRQGNPCLWNEGEGGLHIIIGEEDLEVGACLPNLDGWRGQSQLQRPLSQPSSTHPQCWQCGEVEHLKRSCPMLKGKGLFMHSLLETAPCLLACLTESFPMFI